MGRILQQQQHELLQNGSTVHSQIKHNRLRAAKKSTTQLVKTQKRVKSKQSRQCYHFC